jgi:glutamine amidotransferase
MGWNTVTPKRSHALFDGLADDTTFYFLHSYYFHCDNADDVLATTQYGVAFPCAVGSETVWGVQFHPEKSHGNGIKLLQRFGSL